MKEYFIIGLLLITYSQGQSVCSTNESCEECNELIEDFRNGRITKKDLLDRQCYNGNSRQFACCKYRPEKKECEYNGEKCMECPTLINDFRNGKVTRTYVESKRCGNSRSTFCCSESKPKAPTPTTSTQRTTRRTTTRATSTPKRSSNDNPDSPSYIPRVEDETCGQLFDSSNIVQGNDTKPGRYPFMALIGANKNNNITWRCGGTIINRWYILTAAHCYLDYNLSQEIVNVGEYNIGEEEDCITGTKNCLPPNQIISVQKIQNHQSFKYIRGKGLNDDISLVKLWTPIILNSYVQLICLPLGLPAEYRRLGINDYERDIIGVKAHAIGWGYTTLNFTLTDNNGTRFAKNIQQFVDLPIISNTEVVDQILKWGECLGLWTSVTHDHAVKTFRQMLFNLRCEDKFSREGLSLSDGKRLCAGGGDDGKDTCKGDSGGPLVINKFVKGGPTYGTLRPDGEDAVWIQVGLTSFGSKDCGGGKPGVYTRLSRYIDWIRENLK